MNQVSGLHLEIDPRGGEMSIYEKEGGQSPVGGMFPQKILDFRLSETASGALSGTLY